jgi:hypothetical protein
MSDTSVIHKKGSTISDEEAKQLRNRVFSIVKGDLQGDNGSKEYAMSVFLRAGLGADDND